MLQKWLMFTLSSTLLFTMPTTSNVISFHPTMQIAEDKADLNGMIQKDRFGLIINPIQEQFEKDKIENDKKKAEELKLQKEKEIEEQKKNEPQWQEFELTFYSSLNCENGFGAITSTGSKLFDGVVASNHYKINTKIKLQGWGEVTVLDRGSDKYFNNDYRLDVFIPRESNESDSHYFNRVNKMGRVKIKGCVIK